MIEFKGKYNDELRKFSSGPIQNKVLTINSEHPSSWYHFERKIHTNISPSNQKTEQPEEELMELKIKQQIESNMFSS